MVLTAVTFATAQAATMDEIKEATDALIEFIEKGDYKKAQGKVDFLSAALNEFDFDVKKKFFKDDLAGFIGGEMSAQSVMGISVIERTYTRGGKTVKVSLTDLVASAGPAGLAAMDQMFGQQQATFRLPGRVAASVTNQGGLTEITATIGRSIFRVESSNTKEEKVKEVANAFPIKELLDYVEGR
jgi:hypothetical protein